MTPHEIELATALRGAGWAGSRFMDSMAYLAANDPQRELTLRQRHYLEIMAWRYRRQLPRDLQPFEKPPNMPRVAAVPKEARQVKSAAPAATTVLSELPLFATPAGR